MRISDASGHYEDVILRPKGELNRRLARPLAVISSLFKSNRENSVNHEENEPKLSYDVLDDDDGDDGDGGDGDDDDDKNDQKKFKKRSSWNIFKSKRKNQRRMETPSFQHFQEPLNIERLSLPIGGNGAAIDMDLEWYDLNKEEMSLFEARMSDIVSEFNNYSQTSGESESESIYRCNLSRHLTVSSNILWSHNLSVSCQSNGNASNINLLGANINKDQINSDIYIENGEILAQNVFGSGQNSSFVSTDSDGYTVMPPFLSKKYIEPTNLIDSVIKSMDSHLKYDSDESSHLSSGFGSDTGDAATPQKSIPFINSPTTSDFSDAYPSDKSNECSPTISTTETAKNMQKISKKRRLRIQSRKLLGMLHVKHMPSSSSSSSSSETQSQSKSQTVSNVMPTPQNKSPIECMKKVYKGTPFKIRLSKQPVRSLQI